MSFQEPADWYPSALNALLWLLLFHTTEFDCARAAGAVIRLHCGQCTLQAQSSLRYSTVAWYGGARLPATWPLCGSPTDNMPVPGRSLPGPSRRRLRADIALEGAAYRGRRTSLTAFQQATGMMSADGDGGEGGEEEEEDGEEGDPGGDGRGCSGEEEAAGGSDGSEDLNGFGEGGEDGAADGEEADLTRIAMPPFSVRPTHYSP